MKALLLIVSLLAWPIIGIQFGCLHNATLSALSTAMWVYNVTGCYVCACYTVRSNAVAYNCYMLENNNIRCLIFQNYSDAHNGIEVLSNQNQSFTCFTQLPPQHEQTSVEMQQTTVGTTGTELDLTTASAAVCSDYTLPTVLLRLINSPRQNYTQYSFVYRASAVRTTLMFCFLNQPNPWALDDVSVVRSGTSTTLIGNGGFETANWAFWTPYNSAYFGSGITTARPPIYPHSGSRFYIDIQNTSSNGVFQNFSTIIGVNYTIEFYLANPLGGNRTIAVASLGT